MQRSRGNKRTLILEPKVHIQGPKKTYTYKTYNGNPVVRGLQ